MANNDADMGHLLLDQEERALAEKRQAVKDSAAALTAWRKSAHECTSAFGALRRIGFSRADIVQAFDLTKEEALTLFPRKSRQGSADAAETGREQASDAVQ